MDPLFLFQEFLQKSIPRTTRLEYLHWLWIGGIIVHYPHSRRLAQWGRGRGVYDEFRLRLAADTSISYNGAMLAVAVYSLRVRSNGQKSLIISLG